ncbi:MAG: GntR family transcriptional regulator [Proteobacteria bacterium]|nr:GntR family transcriptional regulator [Pseudomonadota bacterium]
MRETSTEASPLQQRVAREIVALVRRAGLTAGEHLRESHLAEQIGTSRSPVQAALRLLASEGVLQRDANRGYFLTKDAADWSDVAVRFSAQPDDPLYLEIAAARQSRELPDEVSEAELMRRFQVARSTLRKVLARIGREGWIEQRVGHGWCFLPMIDSTGAYEESYLFRQSIEPAGLLGPSFRVNPAELAALKREQERIATDGYLSMTPIELFEANSRFHETLAEWSGNRFILQSVRQVNRLRRLIEYRQASRRAPRQTQAAEHLEILRAIERQDPGQAASLMRAHLDGARRGKSQDQALFG